VARLAVIVLAAGQSTRFSDRGAHKLLARLGDATVVRHAVRAAMESGVGDVYVVTGAEAAGVAVALGGLDVRLVHEPAYADGMATSLRRGVSTLESSVDAVLIGLGDQPCASPAGLPAGCGCVARLGGSHHRAAVRRLRCAVTPGPVRRDGRSASSSRSRVTSERGR
jgi:molybdenum cofactor cytidylyltransferase